MFITAVTEARPVSAPSRTSRFVEMKNAAMSESDEHAVDEAQLAAATLASEECRNPTLCAACVREEAAACSGAKAQRQNCSNPVLRRFSPEPPSPDANKGFFGPIKDAVSAPGVAMSIAEP